MWENKLFPPVFRTVVANGSVQKALTKSGYNHDHDYDYDYGR